MKAIELNDVVVAEIGKVTEVASYLWQRGWAERNGGNVSVDITDIFGELSIPVSRFPHCPLGMSGEMSAFPEDSAGHVFFVKGTGERIRDLRDPGLAGCVLRIDDEATGYHLLWGGRGRHDYKPTSEFISHVEIVMDKRRSGTTDRCVIHTHPSELIALSHHPRYAHDEIAFTQVCWQMLPEVRAFVPRGIGIVPYCLPGSKSMADKTTEKLRRVDVAVWEKHGAVAVGRDALEAFDFLDVANKGAMLFLQCLAAGFEPEGISADGLNELKAVFGL